MNKRMEEIAAKAIVGMAVKTAKLPNQLCPVFLGKSKAQMDLTVSDYEELESFMRHNA